MERIDLLGRKNYRLIQDTDAFCFGMDAVLLADFVQAGPEDAVLDLGTGNGVLPLLLDGRDKGGCFTGLEIQPKAAALACRNMVLNGLQEKVRIVCGDLKEASALLGRAAFSIVVTNPPYMNENHGLVNPDEAKAVARHELRCTLEDVIRESAAVLQPGGRCFMIHRPRRLTEILTLMSRFGLAPKRLRFVHSFADSPAEMVLVEGARGGKPWIKTMAPLIVYGAGREYTAEIRRIYFGEEEA